MKKSLSLIFVFIFVFAFVSCGPTPNDTIYYYGTPKNGVYDAPEEFLLDWDIASVRDNSVTKDGYYSMPIYMFETYEEFLHLKDIVGMDEIGGEIDSTDYCSICGSDEPCDHDKYNEKYFENYTLLVGWHQYSGVVITNHDSVANNKESSDENDNGTIVAKYELSKNGDLVVYLHGALAVDGDAEQQWVLVSVPKNKMAECDSIAFLVQLPQE